MLNGNRFFHLFLAHLWILLGRGNSDIIVKPVDTEVRIDDSTYLKCTISDPSESVNWYHYAVGDETHNQRIVYFGDQLMEPYDKRFEVRKNAAATSFRLYITNVKIQDAGIYVCHDVKTGTSEAAQVIVLEGDPTCLSNISPLGFIGPIECGLKRDTILLSCSITFHGNVPSTLQWTRVKGGDSFPIIDTLLTCSISNPIRNIVCNYTAESDIEYDGSFFICKTKLSGKNHYECSTHLVKVHYAIDDKVSISKKVGDSAVCTARTNSLSCDYKWIWSDGVRKEVMSESSSLAISRGGWHQCKATCKFRDTECTFDVLVVIASPETTVKNPERKTTKVGTAIGVVLFIGALIFCLVVRVMTRRRRIAKKYQDADLEEIRPLATTKRPASVKPVKIRKEFIFENLTFTKEFEEIKMIQTRANRIISGIALFHSNLYVTHAYYSVIEVYDSLTLDFERNLVIDESWTKPIIIIEPLDIASSQSSNCLFIAFLLKGQSRCQIKSLDAAGNTLHSWFTEGSDCRLSVYESNVIVCTTNKNQIIEYSPIGEKLFTVTMTKDDGFDKLLHAIRIAETQYAISYTVTGSDEYRMSIVERKIMTNDHYSAKILYSSETMSYGMNKPICLVQEWTNQVLVADSLNNRVLRIHSSMIACEVVIRDGRIKNLRSYCCMDHHPIRMCLDESRQKLFVAMRGSCYLDAGIISTFREHAYDQSSSNINGSKSVLAEKAISYTKELGHVKTILTKANLVISGTTLLSDKLYVVHKNCSTIEVYNSTTFEYSRALELSNFLTNPLDITSSELQNNLYVVDLPNEESQCRTKRLNVDGDVQNHWFIDDNECRLSVYERNVIACLPNRRQIIEYSPSGEVIFKVSLSPSDGFDKLWHVIKVTDSRYAVSHKVTSSDEHRLTIVEKEIMADSLRSTRIVYFTSPKSCGIYTPICLVQDWKGHILVAEKLNNRVLLIDLASNTCEVILRNGCFENIRSNCKISHHPVRMCLDESSEKLFVAMEGSQLNTGSISIFRVQDTVSM